MCGRPRLTWILPVHWNCHIQQRGSLSICVGLFSQVYVSFDIHSICPLTLPLSAAWVSFHMCGSLFIHMGFVLYAWVSFDECRSLLRVSLHLFASLLTYVGLFWHMWVSFKTCRSLLWASFHIHGSLFICMGIFWHRFYLSTDTATYSTVGPAVASCTCRKDNISQKLAGPLNYIVNLSASWLLRI